MTDTAEHGQGDALAPLVRGLDAGAALELRGTLAPMLATLDTLERDAQAIVVSSVEQIPLAKAARAMRLDIRRPRIALEKALEALKRPHLDRCREIDAFARVVEGRLKGAEKHLLEQEKFAEREEARQIAELAAERDQLLRAEGANLHALAPRGTMSSETWTEVYAQAKRDRAAREAQAIADEQARVAAAAKAAQDRAAAEEAWRAGERERIREEERRRAEAAAGAPAPIAAPPPAAPLPRVMAAAFGHAADTRQAAPVATDADRLRALAAFLAAQRWPDAPDGTIDATAWSQVGKLARWLDATAQKLGGAS